MNIEVPPRRFSGSYPAVGNEPGDIGLDEIRAFLRKAIRPIVLGITVMLILAAAYVQTRQPSYEATANLIYDPQPAPSFVSDARAIYSSLETATRIESQVEIIRSAPILFTTIKKLQLDHDPEFVKPPEPGEEIDSALSLKYALRALQARIKVRRLPNSAVLEVSVRSTDPAKAARITNTVANTYVASLLQANSQSVLSGRNWLHERMTELRKQAFEALQDAEQFKLVGSKSASESRVTLAELESVAATYRRMYESMLLRYTETAQRVSYPMSDSRVFAAAEPPLTPAGPTDVLIYAFAAMLGALAGIGFTVVLTAASAISPPSSETAPSHTQPSRNPDQAEGVSV